MLLDRGSWVAAALLRELDAVFLRLVAFPEQGRVRPDLTRRPIRFVPWRSGIVAYDPRRRPLRVLRVLHASRDLGRALRGGS